MDDGGAGTTRAVEHPTVPAWTRVVVYGFLALILVAGLGRIELWPLSGFRLFAVPRTAEDVSRTVRIVDVDGAEHALDAEALPAGVRQSTRVLRRFEDLDRDEREAYCRLWADLGEAQGADVAVIRIYEVRSLKRPDAPPPERTLVDECDPI